MLAPLVVLLAVGCAALEPRQTVQLPSRSVDVGRGIDSRIPELLATQPGPVSVVVVVEAPLTPADRASLATFGLRLEQALASTAHLARLDAGAKLDAIRGRVVWLAPLEPVDRVDPQLWRRDPPKWAMLPQGRVKVLVRFHDFVPVPEARQTLERFASNVRPHGPSGLWAGDISLEKVAELAGSPGIKWIEPGPDPMMPLGDKGA